MYYERLMYAAGLMEKSAGEQEGKKDKKKKKKKKKSGLSWGSVLAGALGVGAGFSAPTAAKALALASVSEPDGPSKQFKDVANYVKAQGVPVYVNRSEAFKKVGPVHINRHSRSPYAGGIMMPADMQSAGALAHEYGHSVANHSSWELADALAQGVGQRLGGRASALGLIGNGILAATGNNYKAMGAIAGASALLNAPRLVSEIAASVNGQKAITAAGGSVMDRVKSFGGIPSYLAVTVAPALPMLGRYIYDKFSKPEDEEEEYEEEDTQEQES